MLRFVGLRDAPDDAIRRFVTRWGPLRLEPQPVGFWALTGKPRVKARRASIDDRAAFREDPAIYRREALRIGSLLDCAADLYQGRIAPAERWAVFTIPQRYMDQLVPLARPDSPAFAQRVLAWQASQLQRDYGAIPSVDPVLRDQRSFRVTVASRDSGLAGALAYQVLVALARGEPFGWCDILGCDDPAIRRSHGRWYCEAHDTPQAKNANRQRRKRLRTPENTP